jgi:hypothetical protein
MTKSIFIHCQTFSRKPNAAGQCVDQVIAEGLRLGGYHPHVANPLPPLKIGGDLDGFRALHDRYVEARKTVSVLNDKVHFRSIRRDRHTLFTIVASYPIETSTLEHGKQADWDRFGEWRNRTIAWVHGKYGKQMKVAFHHFDETFPHIHIWLLADNPEADATALHPGKVAKAATIERLRAEGAEPAVAVKAGNRALKEAMRLWIDDYHRAVGAPLGLRRDGPKRRRLSRSQYVAEQAMLDHHRQLEADRARLASEVAALQRDRDQALRDIARLEEVARKLGETRDKFIQKTVAIQADLDRRAANLTAHIKQTRKDRALLQVIARDLQAGTISFDPGKGWRLPDPTPYLEAKAYWAILAPAIRNILKVKQTSDEEGRTPDADGRSFEPPDELPEPKPYGM